MTSPYHHDDADYGISQYPARQQRPQRPMEQPQQNRQTQDDHRQHNVRPREPPIRLNQPRAPPNVGRYPTRPPQQRIVKHADYTMSANFSDDTPFDDFAYYEQSPQWSLPGAQNPRGQGPTRDQPNAPPRPHRTDSLNTNLPPPRSRPDAANPSFHPVRTQSRNATSNRQLNPHMQPLQHHQGSGQWVGELYNLPPQQRLPAPPPSGVSRLPRPVAPDNGNQSMQPPGAVQSDSRRGSLGPPPSARKGSASMYPPANPPWTIKEESDSMRGSTKSAGTPGREKQHVFSFAPRGSSPPPPQPPLPPPQVYAMPGYFPETHSSQDRLTENTSGGSSEYISAPERFNGGGNGNPSGNGTSGSNDNGNSSGNDNGNSSGNDSGMGSRDEKREGRLGNGDTVKVVPSREPAPVRQASLGRKGKPKLTNVVTTRGEPNRQPSVPHMREPVSALHPSEDDASVGAYDPVSSQDEDSGPTADGTQLQTFLSTNSVHRVSPADATLSSGTGLIDASSDEDEGEPVQKSSSERAPVSPLEEHTAYRSRAASPVTQIMDSRVNVILGGLEKGGALSSTEAAALKKPMAGMSDRASKRRPPRLDMDMVRQAEARGSLTSLSDLIKRATRLASNLDNGKTASRLNFDDFYHEPEADGGDNNGPTVLKRRSGASLSDILASFPPPAPKPSRLSERKFFTRRNMDPFEGDGEKDERRNCCGLPLWAFILIVVLLILLIAAAVIVPVVLVVVPKHQSHSSASVSSCQNNITCANGGTAIQGTDSSCQCVCAAGFTGSNCTQVATGCTSVSFGSSQNVPIGNAIPPVVQSASTNYSIPLNGDFIYSLLSNASLSCNTENALVTFNGRSTRRSDVRSEAFFAAHIRQAPSGVSPSSVSSTKSPPPSQTSHSSRSQFSFLPTGTTTITTSQAQTSSIATPSPSVIASPDAISFARVVVLYILQISAQIDFATSAQQNFQVYFSGGASASGNGTPSPMNISLGNNFRADIVDHLIYLPGNIVVGENGARIDGMMTR